MRRLPTGCAFAPRCSSRRDGCRATVPAERYPEPGRMAACIAVEDAVGYCAAERAMSLRSGEKVMPS